MKNINESWIKDNEIEYKIRDLIRIEREIDWCATAYASVFNGAPFYENWTLEEAKKIIENYIEDDAIIITTRLRIFTVGFLIAMNKIPEELKQYIGVEDALFIEEIGTIDYLKRKGIGSEMVRYLLTGLDKKDKYIGYRTNAMRYFETNDTESFESTLIRTKEEDKIKRMNNEKIIIPQLSESEKQAFINKYIELIKYDPSLDVSNSNALMRSIFGIIDFSKKDNNYTFQKDPTGDANDRIFPIIDLDKTLRKKR